MAVSRFYSATAGRMTLNGAITDSASAFTLDTVVGLPGSRPYTLMIDPGLATEELVDVTAIGGLVVTVTRGVDGTFAQAHLTGAEVRHCASARDYQDSRNHEAALVAHGATGAVVGTTNVQALTNKSISGSTNTLSNIPTSALASGPITGTTGTFSGPITVGGIVTGTGAVLGTNGIVVDGDIEVTGGNAISAAQLALTGGLSTGGNVEIGGAMAATNGVSGTTGVFSGSLSGAAISGQSLTVVNNVACTNVISTGSVSTGPITASTGAFSGSLSGAAISGQSLTLAANLAAVNGAFTGTVTDANKTPYRMAAGQITVGDGSVVPYGGTQFTVTFPSSRFSVAPFVFVCFNNAPSGTGALTCRYIPVSQNSGYIYVYNAGSVTVGYSGLEINWWAVQMLSGAASG